MKSVRLGLLAASFLISTAAGAQQATAPAAAPVSAGNSLDRIIAVVDEDVILESELAQATNNIKSQYAGQAAQLPPDAILRKQVLERLILLRLQTGRASEIGIKVSDAELNQAVASIAAQNKLNSEQLSQRLAADGLSMDAFRRNLRDEIAVQRLRQSYVQSRVQVSEGEADQLLASQAIGGPEARLANILVALPDNPSAEQIGQAQRRIEAIRTAISNKEMDFKSAAIRYSDAQNALDGGEIGWRTYDAIPPAFANAIRSMKPGEITQAVRGPSGYQIVQLIEVRDASTGQMATQYNAMGIMIAKTSSVGSEAAKAKIEDIRKRIEAGEDFAKLAKQYSDDPSSKSKGGDMGWFRENDYGASVGNAVQILNDGDLSPAFETNVGWHIIKRVATRQTDVSKETQRNKARDIIFQRKADEEFERFLRQLRADAFVESRLKAS
jgi:peptidyl-prolyl cis-trans isomerase SurA